MSTLLWFILIAAFMFFMHRGRGAHGGGMGCCGGHAHGHGGSQDHDHSHHGGRDHNHQTKPNLEAIPEAEYEEVGDERKKLN